MGSIRPFVKSSTFKTSKQDQRYVRTLHMYCSVQVSTHLCVISTHSLFSLYMVGGVPWYMQMASPCKRPPPILAREFQAPMGSCSLGIIRWEKLDSYPYICCYSILVVTSGGDFWQSFPWVEVEDITIINGLYFNPSHVIHTVNN